MIKTRQTCRICGSPLIDIFNFGEQYVAGYVSYSHESYKFSERKIPLVLCRCDIQNSENACGLVQLRHTTPFFLLYRDYFYKSGINESMVKHLHEVAEYGLERANLTGGDSIIDIGANDGTLLKHISQGGPYKLFAFEPAKNLSQYYHGPMIKLINNFFSAKHWHEKEKAKLIFSIAMFYDLEDPHAFVRDIKTILADDGLWIVEQSYLPTVLKRNAFDSICVHEHLETYSLSVIEYLLEQHGLKVVDGSLNDVNGGSIRLTIAHEDMSVGDDAAEKLYKLRLEEFEMELDTVKPYDDFRSRVNSNCEQLKDFIKEEVAKGKKVFAYGASTKGAVILQHCKLDKRLIGACADRNRDKCGLMMGGIEIPIISEEEARRKEPDYFLILPWHFIDGFMEREKEFLSRGGKFIVPMPRFRVISHES